MRTINYIDANDRKINGMYHLQYINSPQVGEESFGCILWHPKGYIVKPVLDYLSSLAKKGRSKQVVRKHGRAIYHYYNFLRLHGEEGRVELTNEVLDKYIIYLSYMPKNFKKRPRYRDIRESDITVLPVHPFINRSDTSCIRSILKEWLGAKVSVLYNPYNTRYEEEENLWRYNADHIYDFVRFTLDYLSWLSSSELWRNVFNPIAYSVAHKNLVYNEYRRRYISQWDVMGRICNITSLKKSDNRRISHSRERIFYETELIRFFSDESLKNFQRLLVFVIMLLSGCRISECLNLQINIRVQINNFREPFGNQTTIYWEDIFKSNMNINQNNDIWIDEYLNFNLRFAKRPKIEDTRRKNKTSWTRMTKLRDYFEMPIILSLDKSGALVEPSNIKEVFFEESMFTSKPILELLKNTMTQYQTDLTAQYRVGKIRQLINRSWFGNLLRQYLISRELMKNQLLTKPEGNYLFMNLTRNKGFPVNPQTVSNWFATICSNQKIVRNEYISDPVIGHSQKKSLSIHSFRHTYIAGRINQETVHGIYNPAALKKEVGHVHDSQVTEITYYVLEEERQRKAYTRVFESIISNIDKIALTNESNKNDEGLVNNEEGN